MIMGRGHVCQHGRTLSQRAVSPPYRPACPCSIALCPSPPPPEAMPFTPPAQVCNLSRLELLNAQGNRLVSLPDAIGQLTSLRLLGLKSNLLEALPASFSALAALKELFLTDNRLRALPEGFGRLPSLVKLQASFNGLEALPEELGDLPCLELMRVRRTHRFSAAHQQQKPR